MDKFEAGEKLAEAVEGTFKRHLYESYGESADWSELDDALVTYLHAPAMPSPERILKAMEFFEKKGLDWTYAEVKSAIDGKWYCGLCEAPREYEHENLKHIDICPYKLAHQTLAELRKAVKG